MNRSDIEAISDLAGGALTAGGRFMQRMHMGIAGRPFGILGQSAAPARIIHDKVSGAVYEGVSLALVAAARTGAAVWAGRSPADGPELGSSPVGSVGLAVLNGLYGNHLKQSGNPLALSTEVRSEGGAVDLTPTGLAGAFPDASARIAVFVHGLFETDESWRRPPLSGERPGRRTYGEQLREDAGFTPVHLRYNTGLRVSDNGRSLAKLLDALVAGWPVEVAEIVLVGHSMGGLVARSACHYGAQAQMAWARTVRHVFCLGTPHLGADLEKGLNVLGSALARLRETAALAELVNARSVGIKDLRYGSCVEEDWCDCDPDEFLRDRCSEVPFLPGAHYYFIAVTLDDGPVGALLGDLLVRIPSASGRGGGRGRRIPFEVDHGLELTGLHHFDLLNHPSVYEQIRAWVLAAPVAVA